MPKGVTQVAPFAIDVSESACQLPIIAFGWIPQIERATTVLALSQTSPKTADIMPQKNYRAGVTSKSFFFPLT
jgi:hypothetical protein